MKQKLILTSIFAIVITSTVAHAAAPVPLTCVPGWSASESCLDEECLTELYFRGYNWRCPVGYYCDKDEYTDGWGDRIQGALLCGGECPSNYNNDSEGLKSIEECCIGNMVYDSTTGLCKESGLYQVNQTYPGAAVYENLGVYSGTATANANYKDVLYTINPGNYLKAGDEGTETICPVGSYCGGLIDALYSATEDQGITACPTIDGKAYTSSTGSSSVSSCYTEYSKACSVVNPIKTGGNTHITGVTYANTDATGRRLASDTINASSWNLNDTNACDITNMTCENGYHYKAGVDLTSIIGNASSSKAYASIDNSGLYTEGYGSNKGQSYYGISDNNTWAIDYGNKGILTGTALCSTTDSNDSYSKPSVPDETGGGEYCYCQLAGYTPVDGTKQSLSSAWLYHGHFSSVNQCASGCAKNCVESLRYNSGVFRTNLFAALPTCEPNTINITWGDTDAIDVTANNAGTVVYGEDIRTPVKAQHKAGKVFTGWTFSKPTE